LQKNCKSKTTLGHILTRPLIINYHSLLQKSTVLLKPRSHHTWWNHEIALQENDHFTVVFFKFIY